MSKAAYGFFVLDPKKFRREHAVNSGRRKRQVKDKGPAQTRRGALPTFFQLMLGALRRREIKKT